MSKNLFRGDFYGGHLEKVINLEKYIKTVGEMVWKVHISFTAFF